MKEKLYSIAQGRFKKFILIRFRTICKVDPDQYKIVRIRRQCPKGLTSFRHRKFDGFEQFSSSVAAIFSWIVTA
jgi:hypothetical protein